jgi:isoquinoline 1-oxidoreductase beta subunit
MKTNLFDEVKLGLQKQGISRRGFLKLSGITGGGFVLAATLPASFADELGTLVGSAELNTFVQLSSDGTITIYSARPDMGQGVKTSLPMIVAEEMGAKWADVVVLQSAVGEEFGGQWVGGSNSIAASFNMMRQMGASAREMLIGAAAETLELPRGEFTTNNSEVIHESGRKLTFGQLASLAVKQPVPDEDSLTFKDAEDYTIIGTSVSGVDNLVITTGLALFGIDTEVPDMLYGAYHKCPAIGGSVVSANLEEIKALPGVKDAFVIEGNGRINQLMPGIGIIGDSTWAVFNAKQKLKVNWDESNASKDSWRGLVKTANGLKDKRGRNMVVDKGSVDAQFDKKSNKVVEGFYTYPFVAHFCMEPMNCTASYVAGKAGEKDSVEIWVPTQNPASVGPTVAGLYGVEKERIEVHVTRLGGGFGRRFSTEFVCESVELSKRVKRPVKLTWTREDDIRHDYYRVGGFQALKGAVDQKGKLVAWDQHFIGMRKDGKAVSGSRFSPNEFPLPNLINARGTSTMLDIATPCGPWRAPGANTHAFVVQSFIHELAHLAGRDHLEFLLELMGKRQWLNPGNIRSLNTGRAIDVTTLAAKQAGWGKKLPAGHGLGLAFHFSHAAHIAEVAELSVDENKKLTVHRVTVAVDVGPIINRSGALSQVKGSIIDGLSTMVGQEITMEAGRIEQSNLHDYPVLRIPAAPEVDVHFIESDNPPTGLGEPGLPPLAPAVGNAIFAATGHRVRTMPLSKEGYSV